jgi:hypothetical protein
MRFVITPNRLRRIPNYSRNCVPRGDAVRWRTGGTNADREQIKWLAYEHGTMLPTEILPL